MFQKKLNNLHEKGLEIGVTSTDKALRDRIVDHLSGSLRSGADNYDRNYTIISLNSLSDEIQRVYNRQSRYKTHTNNNNSSSTKNKSSTKPTPEKNTSSKSNQKVTSKGKGKRHFHIRDIGLSIEDHRQL